MKLELPFLVVGMSSIVALVAGCSAPADQPIEVSATARTAPRSECRLAVEATFEAENAMMTPMCEHVGGGGSGAGGGGGSGAGSSGNPGTPGDPGSGTGGGDGVQAYVECVQACSQDAIACSGEVGKVIGCGYITLTHVQASPGKSLTGIPTGVTVTKDRVMLPPVPPEEAGTPSCVGKWQAQCSSDANTCINACDSKLSGPT